MNPPLILTILASPRLDGLTAGLLERAEQAVTDNGCRIERVNVSLLEFRHCMGCMKCRTERYCCLAADDAHRFATLLMKADGLIIATPTYWGGVPGQLKSLFDRAVYALVDTSDAEKLVPQPLHRKVPASLIITSTAPWPANVMPRFTDTAGNLNRILRPSGFSTDILRVGGTRTIATPSDKTLAAAARIGRDTAVKALRHTSASR